MHVCMYASPSFLLDNFEMHTIVEGMDINNCTDSTPWLSCWNYR